MQFVDAYTDIINTKKNIRITTFFSKDDIFSQWHPSVFKEDEVTYISAEQRMMMKKSELFNCPQVTEKLKEFSFSKLAIDFINGVISTKDILSKQDPSKYLNCTVLKKHIAEKTLAGAKTMTELWSKIQHRIKMLGREVSGYIESVWIENREKIVFDTSFLKYSQNSKMKFKLMSTLGSILVEAAQNDNIWGVGMRSNNPQIKNPEKWRGLNLLGKALTNLRYYFHTNKG